MIKTAIDLSALAYQDPSDIEAVTTDFKWIENKDTDTQVFICETPEATHVVFRGTEFDNFNDWATNLDCSFRHGPFGDCHNGFYSDAMSVYWELSEHLIGNIVSGKRIIFTGHSQGGAVATQYFSTRRKQFPGADDICIAVASPRSMSTIAAKTFGELHGNRIYTVINNNDIVTRVPTRLMGYEHISHTSLQYLDEDGNLHTDISWWDRFLDRVKGRVYDFGEFGADGVKDHSVTEYQRIWNHIPR